MSGCSELEPYALQVKGDSMTPEFWDGCVIIIEPGGMAAHGSYVIVDYAGETVFRQLVIEGERRFLKPLNEQYPVTELNGEFTIRGVVVQRAGRRRSQHKHYV
jgi:SOS-response transcriptional repressor LexA